MAPDFKWIEHVKAGGGTYNDCKPKHKYYGRRVILIIDIRNECVLIQGKTGQADYRAGNDRKCEQQEVIKDSPHELVQPPSRFLRILTHRLTVASVQEKQATDHISDRTF
ncbi:MAG TPA: hypothetical protein EYN06_07975 [Myxococcales bacterium]|nr:hypothetical protein [Myxococcales bacterium]HIN86403.1 hypothetical protein [Myxococcales bacterium]